MPGNADENTNYHTASTRPAASVDDPRRSTAWGNTVRTRRVRALRVHVTWPYVVIFARCIKSILFWTSAMGIDPHSSSTFRFQESRASKESRSSVENTNTAAPAPL
jgi:hypothetical protein